MSPLACLVLALIASAGLLATGHSWGVEDEKQAAAQRRAQEAAKRRIHE